MLSDQGDTQGRVDQLAVEDLEYGENGLIPMVNHRLWR